MSRSNAAPMPPESPSNRSPVHHQTAERIRAALERELAPLGLVVEDESARHAGHAGAREGGHFRVCVVSERFRGLSRLARHRLIYQAVAGIVGSAGTLAETGVHALAIEARTPEEVTS